MLKRKTIPSCHPDRPHRSKGLCNACYQSTRYGLGLGGKKFYEENKVACNRKSKEWREANPEQDAALKKEWAKNNPTSVTKNRDFQNARRRCGIVSREQFVIVEQHRRHGQCEICGKSPDGVGYMSGILNMDHCHKTRRFRGVLCHNCNNGLGHFLDDTQLLQSAIDYLSVDSAKLAYA